ncbi:MAG TPA: hypothetical protein VMQ56_15820 [Terracidiphilus sp.]|nr:hypothetical protein [Terracidiphilus sp.]
MLKPRDVKQALCAKGFREDNSRDHNYYFFYYQGKKSHINTKISHNESDLNDFLCSAMARQVKLTRKQFGAFVECALTGEAYEQLLVTAGHVRIEPSSPQPEKRP